MSETPTEAWRRKGFMIKDGALVPIARSGASAASSAISTPSGRKYGAESELERKFMDLWVICGGQSLEKEVHLVPGRKWRNDFYHEGSGIVIELEGFIDHSSRKGFQRDAEKYLTLTLLGFTVIRLTRVLIETETLKKLIAHIKKISLHRETKTRKRLRHE